MKLYNTYTRKKEEFKPIKSGKVGMYCCGPTVYWFAHIGNLKTYIFEDILRRVLEYNNFKVKHVMNITDVGHLTSDADEGEDKMIKAMRREGKTVWDIAEFYTKAFFDDTKKLNILMPTKTCKATEYIKEMVALIKRLEKNGFTYTVDGNVYFDISKFKDYGKLAKLKLKDLKAGARIKVDSAKRNPQDFVLWFTKSKFANQAMQWDSPWGKGFPGWHIECSAMSIKCLGEQFDIHCGGIDHIPVHHTNELAQSEGATGKKWVNYWIHGEFLVQDKGKMSKSSGETLILKTLEDKGYSPLAYRYFVIGAHYRSKLNFSWKAMDGAQSSFDKLKNKILEIKSEAKKQKGTPKPFADLKYFKDKFDKAVNDDLNMPIAMAVMWEVVRSKINAKEKLELLLDFDKILGFDFKGMKEERLDVSEEIEELIKKRETARKNKDWGAADKIRDELKAKGIVLLDTPEGVKWKKA